MEDNITGENKVLLVLGSLVIVVGGLLAGYGCSTVENERTERLQAVAQYGDSDTLENYILDHGRP